uniref:PRA1 family protein n=1 Tax=Compsopogon caeruleus TaxID=31354 RepID=A0A7S1XDC2_9RHOD|mmetsp:Transcript_1908/g.3441  ORF Transcript_1908/g.3441 Transcript_1908/m.3441 type:complete len:216 (+) Transcript_1908:39-686(+)|eukprot:CAMPEP_0184682552 /NCGR_PEP_ID=MMETSP0312-20130426/7715_1 /TAXON_ID=31354 /ORGANISM="Compsopogon coeruleus, Strain SAG 36.94" /LENGTH=215 /DNA_ID=CAMNT_0027134291 /DNA_START=1 /DNA_END=648 /DNA_ORIENTATION=+
MAEFADSSFEKPTSGTGTSTTTSTVTVQSTALENVALGDQSSASPMAAGFLARNLPTGESIRTNLWSVWENSRPWTEFLKVSDMNMPAGADLKDRVLENAKYYAYNYLTILVVLTAFNVLLKPLSFLGVAAIAGLYLYFFVVKSDPILLGSMEIDDRRKTFLLGTVSLLLLWITGAGSTFLSILFSLLILFGAHMALRKSNTEVDFETAYTPANV